ncbi:MAG: glutathione synthetase [Bacteroidetes bacterium]|jgi:MtN3 and saliva related transmembrane protein|nr:glutathione synthetase [Bacteroidota bacterium]
MIFDITIVGFLAGFCTAIAQFPQAYKVIKTGDTHSISIGMYSIMTFGIVLWMIYGILIPDLPMIISNAVCLVPSLYTLYVTIRNLYRTKKNKP